MSSVKAETSVLLPGLSGQSLTFRNAWVSSSPSLLTAEPSRVIGSNVFHIYNRMKAFLPTLTLITASLVPIRLSAPRQGVVYLPFSSENTQIQGKLLSAFTVVSLPQAWASGLVLWGPWLFPEDFKVFESYVESWFSTIYFLGKEKKGMSVALPVCFSSLPFHSLPHHILLALKWMTLSLGKMGEVGKNQNQ